MTKILDVIKGEYVQFVPRKGEGRPELVEDSFRYNVLNYDIEALIEYLLEDNGDNILYPYQNSYTRQSFEIIYD
jgi:hypothetical protein